MKNSINNLSIDIKELIQNYTENNLEIDTASNKLKKLENLYLDQKNKLKLNYFGDYVSGLCYYHNIENYAIYTGIFLFKNNSIVNISSYGDKNLTKKISIIIQSEIETLNHSKIQIIKPQDNKTLKNNLYLAKILFCENMFYIISTLSSSSYFAEKKFKYFSSFIKQTIPHLPVQEFNCLDIYKNIETFINDKIKQGKEIVSYIFYFPYLPEIINHLGDHAAISASNEIEKILSNSFDNKLYLQTISLQEYVVFTPKNQELESIATKLNLSFSIQNIPIPYYSKIVDINEDNSFYKFTEALFSFSNL